MKWSQLWLLISILLGYFLSAMMELIKVRYWSLGRMAGQKLDGRIAEKAGSLIGGLSLGQLAAYIELCDLFITIDTGPMCMATALDIPTISPFAPGNYHKFRLLRNNPRSSVMTSLAARANSLKINHCQSDIRKQRISVGVVWHRPSRN